MEYGQFIRTFLVSFATLLRVKKQKIQLSGEQLTGDFRAALVVRSTAAYAKEEAARSEQETLSGLDAISRGTYLNPTFIPEATQEGIARASVDAHIKKVQASQISEQSEIQMIDLETRSADYIGKKVKITVLDREAKPIESIWFNPHTGEYYPGVVNLKSITGTIDQIMFNKNTLVIKPSVISKLFNPKRYFFMIYVINPETLKPLVQIDL